MSSSPNLPNITGGVPTSLDLGPSIVFAILYGLTLPLAVWRISTYRRPLSLMWTFTRLGIFAAMRVATYSLRAAEAHASDPGTGNYVPNLGLFIAEQVLLGIGFLILIDLIVELVNSHLLRTDVPPRHAGRFDFESERYGLRRIVRLMHLAILAALGLGIAAGVEYSNAITNLSAASQVQTFRFVSCILCLVVAALALVISLFLIVARPTLPRKSSALLALISAIVIIIPAYRLATLDHPTHSLDSLISSSTKVEFWVLQGLMEWLTTVLLLAVDARAWYGAGGEVARASMMGWSSGGAELESQSPNLKRDGQSGTYL